MPKAAKRVDVDSVLSIASETSADGDVLHFLTRTLKAHFLDSEPDEMLIKLQNLKEALDRQETTLASWPDSPSKQRICAALARARNLVIQIVDRFASTAQTQASNSVEAV